MVRIATKTAAAFERGRPFLLERSAFRSTRIPTPTRSTAGESTSPFPGEDNKDRDFTFLPLKGGGCERRYARAGGGQILNARDESHADYAGQQTKEAAWLRAG